MPGRLKPCAWRVSDHDDTIHQVEFNNILRIINFTGALPFLLSTPLEVGRRYQTLMTILIHPLSRGNVHISSTDPHVPPAIDPQYLSNAADLHVLVALCKYSQRISNTEPLRSAITTCYSPGPDMWSDDALSVHIKKTCHSMAHPVGTASMLPRIDGGVVNSRLVVYGTKNLRIVDASIIPLVGFFLSPS
jgi:choline dehydrogenase-like flavoprotein